MDTIRLRTMTEKSIIGFGKFMDLSVGNLFALMKLTDLRWIYYNCSMLTFTEEILEKLGIVGDWKINKPGIDKEKGMLLREYKKNNRPALFKNAIKEKADKEAKNEYRQKIKFERIRYSKGYMQALNQGHKLKI